MFSFKLGKSRENPRIPGPERPDLQLLNKGRITCRTCSNELDFTKLGPLSAGKCPACKSVFPVPMKIDSFWLYEPSGSGGMGSVYKALSAIHPEKDYAVKILPREKNTDPHLIDALIREASIAKSFGRHPHLVYVEAYGESSGEYYSVMEYLHGIRLDTLIESGNPVSRKFALLWSLQLLSAEQKIYDAGYLYRDLKPQNIIIDSNGNLKLFDFGLCRTIAEVSVISASKSIEGSPLYMPPERITGQAENMASEIYSLGMVLFHLISGKPLFSAEDAFRSARKIQSITIGDSLSQKLPPDCPDEIISILARMSARNPDERFSSFKEAALHIRQTFDRITEE